LLLARNWWAVALRGAFGIVFGLIALFAPGATLLSLVLVFAAYLLADGVLGIVAGVRAARDGARWGLLILEGAVTIAMGLIAALWPGLTIVVFVLMMAAWALLSGAMLLIAAYRLEGRAGRIWLALSGIVSVLFGLALAVAPMIGAVVLTWWLGIYGLAFGVALVVLAFRLRIYGEAQSPPRVAAG
jgi:uncharacterized membrane protein HdeD (DUF308 family)